MLIEQKHADVWYFVGSRSTLLSFNAYLTRHIGEISIVVCSDKEGRIRAFENVCAHRQMPIQRDDFGRRALVCPYHAWTYDHGGQLRAVANAHLYGMRSSERISIRLQTFPIKIVGNFIFVKLRDQGKSFDNVIPLEVMNILRESSTFWSSSYFYAHNVICVDAINREETRSLTGLDVQPLSAIWKQRLDNIRFSTADAAYNAGRGKQITCNIPGRAVYSIIDGRFFFIEQTNLNANSEPELHCWIFCALYDLDAKLHEVFEIVRNYIMSGKPIQL